MRGIGLAMVLMVSLPYAANAQSLTTEQYRHPKTANDLVFNKAYLNGVKDGLFAYNVAADPKLFCPGANPLSFDQANDIVMHWSNKKSINADNLQVGLTLLYGLREKFPCRN